MRCSACGRENPEGSQYCSGCGSKLGVRVKGMEASGMGVKPKVTSTVGMGQIRHTVPPPGMCFYHPSIPSQFVCTRCGRPICGSCVKKMGGMIFCVNCAGSVPYTRERPTGVTAIAVLMFIGAVSSFIIGLLVLEEGYSDGVLIGLSLLAVAIVYIFAAIGLFQGKNWARVMYLILCALQIFGYVVSFFGSEDVLLILSPISLFLSILFELLLEYVLFYGVNFFFVVIPLIFIWYLTRPRVKEFFGVT